MNKIGLLQGPSPIFDTNFREHAIPYSTIMEVKVLTATDLSIQLPDIDNWFDKFIIGLYVRPNNAGATIFGKLGNALVSKNAIENSYLKLYQNNTAIMLNHPLSHFIHEPGVNQPGTFTQLLIDGGFSTNNSSIEIGKTGLLTANQVFQLTWIWVFKKEYCQTV